MEFWIELVMFAVKGLVKNPTKAAALKKLLLELRGDIDALYPGE